MDSIEDSPDLLAILRERFGHDQFRPGQAEIIDDVMAARPVVSVMPTGAGKSLCYQLPAVALSEHGGVSLVVSPLIALMKDQVDTLRERGVRCAALTSAATSAEQDEILRGVADGSFALVYVAPERFRSSRFSSALARGRRLALMAIDEAHCISEWGHEFRPDYRRLGDVVNTLAPERLIALTATATPEVRLDIAEQLGMEQPALHVRGFGRPALRFSVRFVSGGAEKKRNLEELCQKTEGGVSLVYAATRKNAESYATSLGKCGLVARVYHAGLADQERSRTQDEFMAGEVDVIVATNAFGMGVDKSDIRTVVHADVPKTPEAYYQEAGRGGRDRETADCTLLFSHADIRLQEFLIDVSNPAAEILRELWKIARESGIASTGDDVEALRHEIVRRLGGERPSAAAVSSAIRLLERTGHLVHGPDGLRANRPSPGQYTELDPGALARRAQLEMDKLGRMVEYAYGVGCRQRFLLDYFGDDSIESDWACGSCDVCRGESDAAQVDAAGSDQARKLLELVAQVPGRFGRRRLASLANGTDTDDRFVELPGHGCLRGEPLESLVELFRALEGAALLERARGDYPTLTLSRAGRACVKGTELPALTVRSSGKRNKKKTVKALTDTDADPETAERLRSLRTELAQERAVPPYVIFSNKTLVAIAATGPTSLDDLATVPGIGPAKLDRYGERILAAVQTR